MVQIPNFYLYNTIFHFTAVFSDLHEFFSPQRDFILTFLQLVFYLHRISFTYNKVLCCTIYYKNKVGILILCRFNTSKYDSYSSSIIYRLSYKSLLIMHGLTYLPMTYVTMTCLTMFYVTMTYLTMILLKLTFFRFINCFFFYRIYFFLSFLQFHLLFLSILVQESNRF